MEVCSPSIDEKKSTKALFSGSEGFVNELGCAFVEDVGAALDELGFP